MINLRQSLRSNLLGLDPPRKLRDRSKRYRCIVLRQRRFVSSASYKHCGRRPRMDTQRRISHRGRSLIISRNELAWTSATLVDRGHRLPLVACDLGLVLSRQRSLHQLLRLGKGSDRQGQREALCHKSVGPRRSATAFPSPAQPPESPNPAALIAIRDASIADCRRVFSIAWIVEWNRTRSVHIDGGKTTLVLQMLVLLWCYWSPIFLPLLATDCEDRTITKGP